MHSRTAALLMVLVSASVAAEPPKFRLPDTASPVRYAVDLTVVPGESAFRGAVDIDFAVTESTPVLWLSAAELTVDSATLRTGGATRAAAVTPGGNSFVGFAFDPPLAPGAGTLHVAYSGKIQSTSSAGVFQLRDGQNPQMYVYTQFETEPSPWISSTEYSIRYLVAGVKSRFPL